jgi:predicted ATP-grasp superfamily ATP-dependent carboligase
MVTNTLRYTALLDSELSGSTLLMPSPNGIAYLGQLSLDLIISTGQFQRIGYFDCPLVEPLTAMNTYGFGGQLYTAFELYKKGDVTIIQLRSNVIRGLGSAFASMLFEWIKLQAFRRVVVATGLDQSRRNDAQLRRYMPINLACLFATMLLMRITMF